MAFGTRAYVWVLIGACVGLTAPTAQADPLAEAKELFATGQSLIRSEQFEEAYEAFERGYALSNKALFLFNMAECARSLGDTERARTNYTAFLAAKPRGRVARMARARLAKLPPAEPEPEIERLTVPPPKEATARVSASPTASAFAQAGPMGDGTPDPIFAPAPSQATPETDESGSIFSSWGFWVAVGAVVVAGSVTAVVLTQGNDSGGASVACGAGCATLDFR